MDEDAFEEDDYAPEEDFDHSDSDAEVLQYLLC